MDVDESGKPREDLLHWALADARDAMELHPTWRWILKPSLLDRAEEV